MINMKLIFFIIFCSPVYCLNATNETDTEARKRYGLGFRGECADYSKVFGCMTKCKSLGYGVYKLDRKCKCRCFEVSTVEVLPYFKWRTTGTTRKLPTTRSPRLYDIVGTLSPNPYQTTEDPTINKTSTCPTLPTVSNTTLPTVSNATSSAVSNATLPTVSNATSSTVSNATSPAVPDAAKPGGRKNENLKLRVLKRIIKTTTTANVSQSTGSPGNATVSTASSSGSVASETETVAEASDSTASGSVSEASADAGASQTDASASEGTPWEPNSVKARYS